MDRSLASRAVICFAAVSVAACVDPGHVRQQPLFSMLTLLSPIVNARRPGNADVKSHACAHMITSTGIDPAPSGWYSTMRGKGWGGERAPWPGPKPPALTPPPPSALAQPGSLNPHTRRTRTWLHSARPSTPVALGTDCGGALGGRLRSEDTKS